jgi:hypothetical protein
MPKTVHSAKVLLELPDNHHSRNGAEMTKICRQAVSLTHLTANDGGNRAAAKQL